MKHFYRLSLSLRQLAALEDNIDFEFNLYQSIQILCNAWEKVSKKTITNCYKKVGFLSDFDNKSIQADQLDATIDQDEELDVTISQDQDELVTVVNHDELNVAINCLRRHVNIPDRWTQT